MVIFYNLEHSSVLNSLVKEKHLATQLHVTLSLICVFLKNLSQKLENDHFS